MRRYSEGPWTVNQDSELHGRTFIVESPTESQIAIIKEFNYEEPQDEKCQTAEYNAKLIAAAPELLEVLIRWQDQWVVNGNPEQRANNYSIEQQIKAAIKKATT